jgi:hypothetical protein
MENRSLKMERRTVKAETRRLKASDKQSLTIGQRLFYTNFEFPLSRF